MFFLRNNFQNFVLIRLNTEIAYNVEWLQWGLTNFDSFPTAFLVLLQCITMEGWVTMMYFCADGFSDWFSFAYYTIVIVFGS